jgi:hypothetical protein
MNGLILFVKDVIFSSGFEGVEKYVFCICLIWREEIDKVMGWFKGQIGRVTISVVISFALGLVVTTCIEFGGTFSFFYYFCFFCVTFVFRMTGTLACDDMGRVKMVTYGGHCLHFPVLGWWHSRAGKSSELQCMEPSNCVDLLEKFCWIMSRMQSTLESILSVVVSKYPIRSLNFSLRSCCFKKASWVCRKRTLLIWFMEEAGREGWIGTVGGCVGGAEGFTCDWFAVGIGRGADLFLGGDFIRDLTWSAYWTPDFVGATDVWNWTPWFLWIPPNQISSWGFKNTLGSLSTTKSEQISDSNEDCQAIMKEWSTFWNTTIVIVLEKFGSTCWNRTGNDIPLVAGKLLRRDLREIWWFSDFNWIMLLRFCRPPMLKAIWSPRNCSWLYRIFERYSADERVPSLRGIKTIIVPFGYDLGFPSFNDLKNKFSWGTLDFSAEMNNIFVFYGMQENCQCKGQKSGDHSDLQVSIRGGVR